jgi:hypothetical protein
MGTMHDVWLELSERAREKEKNKTNNILRDTFFVDPCIRRNNCLTHTNAPLSFPTLTTTVRASTS